MPQPPSLGDLKPTFVKVHETHELPKSRREIVTKFESLLNTGGALKVVVELGQPIRVDRLVAANEGPKETPEVPEEDILAAVRNSEVIEMSGPATGNPYKDLFRAFAFISKKRLQPSFILVHTLDELDIWLDLERPTHLEELYGVDVRSSAGVEDNTLLLLATSMDEPGVVHSTLRLVMEKHNEATGRESPKERNSGKRNGRAAGEVGKSS